MTSNDPPSIAVVDWTAEQTALSAIRREVFIEEQHVPEALEWDGLDAGATHVLVRDGDRPIACGRLLVDGHIGRMAVCASHRARGIGRSVLAMLIDVARARGDAELFLHAQTTAVGFYQRAGFTPEGDEFLDAGIPHRTMRLTLR